MPLDNFRKKKSTSLHQYFSVLSLVFPFVCLTIMLAVLPQIVQAQSEVTGGFFGYVRDAVTREPIEGAVVRFTKLSNQVETSARTNASGLFNKANLTSGDYAVTVTKEGYRQIDLPTQKLFATRSNSFQPIADVLLEKEGVTASPTPLPAGQPPIAIATPTTTPPSGAPAPQNGGGVEPSNLSLNPRRDQTFDEETIRALPLGGTTLTRSFDELALLAPGVVPPPQSLGNGTGPGVGPGVGTSGQFSVNGLRSRANNFTVDGSDNNDEDIGVRRQGFFALVPQPIESVDEFTIITALAPAQFGRNLGAQVNALSKSGANDFRGTIFGFFNSSKLNARNSFDNASGNISTVLRARQSLASANLTDVLINGQPLTLFNTAGEKDSLTLFQGGAAIGGPLYRNKLFFFASGEGQLLNGVQERHYAVPTVEQRGLFGTGATGLQQCQGSFIDSNGICRSINGQPVNFARGFPTSSGGDAIFSLFPFANDPNGIYGRNTYTQALSVDARGRILSGRVDYNFALFGGKPQTLTIRYNYTDDKRDLPDVGGAIFSSIRPLTRTDNLSTFLTGAITDNTSNVFRFSYGRTRLRFEELRDATGFLLPVSSTSILDPAERRFLLNARLFENFTIPPDNCTPIGCNVPARVLYTQVPNSDTASSSLGLIGQLNVAGYSPVGVDVFNFPQERKNDTFQIADSLNWQVGSHSVTFGTDVRRAILDSNLPRNARPLVTFNGAVTVNTVTQAINYTSPLDLAAAGAATGFFQTLVQPGRDARIKLGYYQLSFFTQDEWRVAPNLTLSYGLRYEYNTIPKEADNKIESTFTDSRLNLIPGFRQFIADRTQIYKPDRNNFAPRFGFATSLTDKTVIRGGGGVYYDQVIGAVVSQSRNVFPTFTTVNFGGGLPTCLNAAQMQVPCSSPQAVTSFLIFDLFNPFNSFLGNNRVVQSGRLNTFSSNVDLAAFINANRAVFPSLRGAIGSPFGATLPQNELDTPYAYQYFAGIEQELSRGIFLSAAYVGTSGRKLLRFNTPNLGSNYIPVIAQLDLSQLQPRVIGFTLDPTQNPNASLTAGRPVNGVGPISQFETTGRSQYHSLQLQMRGRILRALQYQLSYTLSKTEDDASDVFDLAGSSALPQNSTTKAGEYAPSNFDIRHRFTYSFIYDLPRFDTYNDVFRLLFGGWQIAGTGKYNTGQPFTVNTTFDVNFDGNLTDRLNNTRYIQETGDRGQPLRLTIINPAQLQEMLAPIGSDGVISRNSFRAGSILELDMSFNKRFFVTERQNLLFRVDLFNFINRANYGIPVRFLEAPGFGRAVETVTPGRRIQFALKYVF
jgi:hypothetical protein